MNFINKYISALISLVLCLFVTMPTVVEQGQQAKIDDIANQNERISQLEQLYQSESFVPIDESTVTGFDVDTAYKSGVKFNEVSFIATHNSYQKASVPAYQELYGNLSTVTFGAVKKEKTSFSSDTLTEQFNLGIRSIELDVETVVKNNQISFVCCHSPIIDATSTCYDFSLALKEIKLWSDANPNHLPITVIIEPKKIFIPEVGMRFFSLNYANELDKQLRSIFGETLLTPSDMMGSFESLKQMRENDGWLTLKETAGKVMFLLHDTTITENYISQDKSLRTQAMFPMLRYEDVDRDCASFILANKPKEAIEKCAELDEKRIVYRTLVDDYGTIDNEREALAFEVGAHIMSTDYPIKADANNTQKVVSFNGATVKCK
ncbi:MAG: Ca2+-dependent phosphoinositide-specific phospholipase C [Faecalibacterium sp.]|nr:Ca2+-dependent phosphoinositide-specific phospholipase C [Ruminococcus sp.]MCM1391728.1 Ca2+-dependent phosphoinositide-specific phospholipase C [Ruminococcus sp.]MCM1485359.1 Ca2+-dependent phosphoinositide-specific phospholipase C [Faecalibacterium sp.]